MTDALNNKIIKAILEDDYTALLKLLAINENNEEDCNLIYEAMDVVRENIYDSNQEKDRNAKRTEKD
jgi:hypothetical protein